MVKITDIAFETLRNKSPEITNNPDLRYHNIFHLLCHPAFDGDLSKKQPSFGTSIHHEILVQITQTILLDSVAVYQTNGSFYDVLPLNWIKTDDWWNLKPAEHSVTIDEMKEKLNLFYKKNQQNLRNMEEDDDLDAAYDDYDDYDDGEYSASYHEPIAPQEDDITDIKITDQAIAYHMVRAELIRKQIEEAGYCAKDLQTSAIDKMDPKIFVVPKQNVIKELENRYCKDGETYSIKTSVNPSNKLSSDDRQHEGVAASGLSVNRMI